MAKSYQVQYEAPLTPIVQKTVELLTRTIAERTGLTPGVRGDCRLTLSLRAGRSDEGFGIATAGRGGVRIVGHDERGLLYGVGKFLRDATLTPGCLQPGKWRGTSVPKLPVRAMYFATHFHNFYHDAPVEQVTRYIEDLALWGCNCLAVWYDMHHYTGIDDAAAQAMIRRLRVLLAAANRVGMGAALTTLANEAYANSPVEMRAVPSSAHYHVELCPYKPGAMELMMRWRREMFQAFADLNIEHVWIWPYDQGGCLCPECAPWGANGFLKVGAAEAALAKEFWPRCQTVVSTWNFEYDVKGEWAAFDKVVQEHRPEWIDYLMVDTHHGCPKYVLEHGVPGNYPMLTFPEISMWEMWTWGGYGANPHPQRCQRIWDEYKHLAQGGYPYSEGIFEDLNKIIFLQFYWNPARTAAETVREYAAAEFAPDVAEAVCRAANLLEAGHQHFLVWHDQAAWQRLLAQGWDAPESILYKCAKLTPAAAAEALALLTAADAKLPPAVQRAWRWRILLLRAKLDDEICRSGGKSTAVTEECFAELTDIYAAAGAESPVMPPGRPGLLRLHG